MEQNKYTKVAKFALIIASILGTLLMGAVYELFANIENSGLIGWLLVILVPLGIAMNLFAAYKIHKGSFGFIRVAFWLYILQMVGFDTPNLGFSLTLGFGFNLSWSIGSITIIFNIFAIMMAVILFKAMQHHDET